MGRTVPSFRVAEAQEAGEWKAFRDSLTRGERKLFDEMMDTSRLYISASSSAVRTSRFEGVAMALLFHHFRQLREMMELTGDGRELP
jgi:hypothetical protein